MTPEEKKAFEAELYAWVGREVAPPTRAPDDVNQAMIRHWCEVMGDNNPVYSDAEFAGKSSKGGIVAPATMLMVWGMEGYSMANTGADAKPDGQRQLHMFMEKHGYTGVLGTNCEQDYYRDLRPGDSVIAHAVIHSISPEKTTAMGTGYFIETKTTYTDQNGEPVGSMIFRVIKFKPVQKSKPADMPSADAAKQAPTRIKSPRGHDNEWWWDLVEKEKKLPIQRCKGCGALRHPPRPFCGECQSGEWDYLVSSMEGEVYSYVVLHHPQFPGFTYPLVCAVIDLKEGTRLVSNIIDCKPEDVKIGARVQGEILQIDADSILPQFRLV